MLKRPLIFAVLLFLLGIFLVAYSVNLIVATGLSLGVCGIVFWKTKKPLVMALAMVLILAGMGRMFLAECDREKIITAYSGKMETMKLTAVGFSDGSSVEAYFTDEGRKYRVLLRFKEGENIVPGDIIEGEVTLNQPLGSKIKFPGYAQSLAGSDIFLVASAEKIACTGKREGGVSGIFSSVRVYMDNLGAKHFAGDDRALFNAMVIGDKRLISDELDSSLKASGLNHLAVVSGMHLSVAIAFLTVIARLLFGKKRLSYIFIMLGALVVTILTGAGPSVVRAFIMCAIYLASEIFLRDGDSPSSLSFAVLLMVAVNPFMIFNVGFMLSALSVAGVLIYSGKLSDSLKTIAPEKMASMLAISISAQITVLPIIMYYFGTVSVYSLLSNALLVPVAGFYVVLGMIFILLSPVPFVSEAVAVVMKILSGCISSVSGWVKSLPASIVEIDGDFLLIFVVWAILLVLMTMHPVKRGKYRAIAASVTAAFVCLAVFAPKDKTEIYTVNYGSEVMTVAWFPAGDSFLVDYPDLYDVRDTEAETGPFETLVLSGNDYGDLFDAECNVKRLIVSKMLVGREKEEIIIGAEANHIRLMRLADCEKLQVGGAVIEYVPVEGYDELSLLKVYCQGKTYLSFQGVDGTDIMNFSDSGLKFESDYVILPYTAFACDREMFTGEILE